MTCDFVPPKMTVHSANSSARQKMEAGIRAIELFVKNIKFNLVKDHESAADVALLATRSGANSPSCKATLLQCIAPNQPRNTDTP